MPPEQPVNPTPTPVDNTLAVNQSGEQVLFSIRRHPIGLIGMYIAGGLLLILAALLGLVVPTHLTAMPDATRIGALGFSLVAVVIVIYLLIDTKVYWGNQWILTTDSITQITQSSLFDRQSSQLSLGNLEDVTAEQDGILADIFDYGAIRIETASESGKFIFRYCPNPNFYAQKVLAAREAFEQGIQHER